LKIPYVNLSLQWQQEKKELLPLIDQVLSKGQFVGGEEVEIFEHNISKLCESNFGVSFNSGTDALMVGLHLLGVGPGDEVITPPNSFIASTSAITHLGAIPIFVDVLRDQNIDPSKIEKAITKKTKAIMPVHLTGRMCRMDEIITIANKYSIPVIEDAAQAIGSQYKGHISGSISEVGCFSGHPLKNLNAFGDAGFLITNNKDLAESAKLMSNHGLKNRDEVNSFGFVSRLDTLQAAILNYHLKNLDKVISKRRENALVYIENLDSSNVYFNDFQEEYFDTYHTFVIQVDRRDELKEFLESKGIGSSIHYPIPIHLQPASAKFNLKEGSFPITETQAKKILTLPINQYVTENEIKYISDMVNNFFK
tara:strand:- start:236 stop:1333 length:1098 start_codon:yes stop_codon:yes gene_type:complete